MDKAGDVILCDNKAKNVVIAKAIARIFNAVSVQKNKPEWSCYFVTMPKTGICKKRKKDTGHVLVVMLAYMITKYISDKIGHLGHTRKFAIESLDKIQYIEYGFKGKKIKIKPTNLPEHTQEILKALNMDEKVAKNKTVQ
ncbi:MAG: hypothetical protein L3J11_03150 [Draconibacterium sp.]|nr:hypothetical protein [Draconibacterium sp.]